MRDGNEENTRRSFSEGCDTEDAEVDLHSPRVQLRNIKDMLAVKPLRNGSTCQEM